MNRWLFSLALLALTIGLAACASPPAPAAAPPAQPTTVDAPAPGNDSTASSNDLAALPTPGAAAQALARTDAQGAVEFVVTPLNLAAPGETLEFDVSMNTHSVDLSWDLAAQSVLKTDTGLEVKGLSWPAGSGHHYEGRLTFPAKSVAGKALLEGATTLTLVIRDADAPERVFSWSLSK